MMWRQACLPICALLALAVVPACTGNLGDVFGAFPADVFDPEPPVDGGGGGDRPGGFVAEEVAFLESSQGVTGDVRNVATATVGAQVVAFLSAGADGVHVVDVTEPELVNSNDYVTTVRDAVLTAPAQIDGGRVDALTVIDNSYLVCVAVGVAGANAVTVFHIPTLLARATSDTADLSDAYVARTGTGFIAVPGTATGKAGGAAGAANAFFVATGGPELGIGLITPGTPGTWSALPAITSPAAPQVDRFLDVLVNLTAVYASVQTGANFGIVAFALTPGNPPTVTVTTPQVTELEGEFGLIINDPISGPGNFPLDLAVDALSLFVTGDAEVHIFNVTSPANPSNPSLVTGTGEDTIAVDGSGGFFAVGSGNAVRVYSSLGGPPVLTARLDFTASLMRIRGVALTTSAAGRFVLCCAGERGLRIVQWSNIP